MYPPLEGVSLGSLSLDWSQSSNWFEKLKQADPSARQSLGIAVFFRYGLSATGFEDVHDEDKSLTVFARGQWREDDPELKKL